MGRSLTFYRRLGLAIPAEADTGDHAEVTLSGGLRLAWDTVENVRSFAPEWMPPTGGPGMSWAFRCASPAEVDRVYAELVGAGYGAGRPPWDALWGQRYAVVHDPDGYHVDLFAPSDVS